MAKWHVRNPQLDEREHDYTATFTCTNGETGAELTVAITQKRGTPELAQPASDLVGALRAAAELLRRAASDELEAAKLN